MIRFIVSQYVGSVGENGSTQYVEAAGLSTDNKPTENIVTGSLFMEVDTGKMYAFDEVGGTWNEIGG